MIDPTEKISRRINLNVKDIGSNVFTGEMLKEADALIVCFDVTNLESFYELSKYFQIKMQMELEAEQEFKD